MFFIFMILNVEFNHNVKKSVNFSACICVRASLSMRHMQTCKIQNVYSACIYNFLMHACMCDLMGILQSVLLLWVLCAAKEFMLFCPSSLPTFLTILGKSKLQSFSMWLARVVPNLYFTYPSCSIPFVLSVFSLFLYVFPKQMKQNHLVLLCHLNSSNLI